MVVVACERKEWGGDVDVSKCVFYNNMMLIISEIEIMSNHIVFGEKEAKIGKW